MDSPKALFRLSLAMLAVAALVTAVAAQGGRNTIRIVGSSTVFPFSTAVAERFGQTSEYPAPVVESTGSGGGIKLFCQGVGVGTPDITNTSRQIKSSEIEQCERNGVKDITEVKIGYDGIVLASAREADQIDLTRAQLWQALAKTVPVDGDLKSNPYTHWREIDASLSDKPIKVYGPPPTSGTRDAFVELVMETGCETFAEVKKLDESRQEEACAQMREDGVYIEAGENDNLIVQRLQQEEDAFGIFGFSFLDQNRDKIQGNTINRVEPNFDTIASGKYPVSRSLFFYVKNAHVGIVPGMKAYIAEFTSSEAWGPYGYLMEKGLIPLPDDQREKMAKQAQNLKPMQPEG